MITLYFAGRILVALGAGILFLIGAMLYVSAVVSLVMLAVCAMACQWVWERAAAWRS